MGLSLLGFAGWLLQNFLQLRGVVNLIASRIDLSFLFLTLVLFGWLITSRKLYRSATVILCLFVVTGLDVWAPKPVSSFKRPAPLAPIAKSAPNINAAPLTIPKVTKSPHKVNRDQVQESAPQEATTNPIGPPEKEPTFKEALGDFVVVLGGHVHRISKLSTKGNPARIAPFGDSRSITAYVEGGKLYVDALLYYAPDEPPLELTHNELGGTPRKWDRNFDDSALEIVDENLVPRFQLIYKDARTVLVRGVFQFQRGAVVFEENASHFFIFSRENEVKITRIFQYPSRLHQGQERLEISR